MEAWNSINIPSYPFQMKENYPNRSLMDREMRPSTTKMWNDNAKTKAARESMSIDCARLWNIAPAEITKAESKSAAKREIKKFARILEI